MKKIDLLKGITLLGGILALLAFPGAWAHEHHPPHHGTLVVLGEEFAHVELLLDPATGTLNAYVLDGEAENPVKVSQRSLVIKVKAPSLVLKLKPVANPLTGETVGDTSQYQSESKKLKGLSKFEGSIVRIKAKGMDFKDVWFLYPEGNEGVKRPDEKEKHHDAVAK